MLANHRYWKHVDTPMFVIASQWNQQDFDRITCNVSSEYQDYGAYSTGWISLNFPYKLIVIWY